MEEGLVIVESPAKAKTVGRILGGGYVVKASVGHVRDLPKSGLGVDVDDGFTPHYTVPREKAAVVKEIKGAAKKAQAVYLATDPDREGEAISWHICQAAALDSGKVSRVVFHEITKEAVQEAFHHPRHIDMDLVNAQQARRILDRLVGYKLSPLLWRKVRRGLSAGRVQSVALKMIVDREREIEAFVPREYWAIEAELKKTDGDEGFRATFIGPASGRKMTVGSAEEAQAIVSELERASYSVAGVQKKEVARQPAPPFITSTLQQEGWRKLRFTAKHTMAVAQQLYEGLAIGDEGSVGLITYMRTDSVRVASSAIEETRRYVNSKYGARYLPPRPRAFTRKAKGAQEAHEAIRPTSVWREPAAIKQYLTRDQHRLYELIWKRMVSSQMSPALLDTTTVDIEAQREGRKGPYLLRAKSSEMTFPGFTILYSEGRDDAEDEDGKRPLPPLEKGEPLTLLGLFPEQRFTQPPQRFTEATLVRALEERGIGRPSTYAPILSTIQERGYVKRESGRLSPLELGFLVSDILAEQFPDIVDPSFTAQMEEGLDQIARGERQWAPFLEDFYHPFERTLQAAEQKVERVKIVGEPTDETCPQCGRPMVIKSGRYGRFLSCSGYPECKSARPLHIGVKCPKCGSELVERQSKKRRTFYGCSGYPQCDFATGYRPIAQPCPQCGGLLVERGRGGARCTQCQFSGRVEELEREAGEA